MRHVDDARGRYEHTGEHTGELNGLNLGRVGHPIQHVRVRVVAPCVAQGLQGALPVVADWRLQGARGGRHGGMNGPQ